MVFAALFLIAISLYFLARARVLFRVPPALRENAALRALVDRIDRLADEARDIKESDPQGLHLSVQILDEIRAFRRREDADALKLKNAHPSMSKIAPRAAKAIGRPR